MEPLFYLILFAVSLFLLSWTGPFLVSSLMRIAKFLKWREFIVAFFIVAFATTIPNFFVGIISALNGVPELSFGDVVGGNVFDLTVTIAIVALVAKGIPAESKLVQSSSLFTILVAILPLFLVLDHKLSRLDGAILIGFYLIYSIWLFSKKERFAKIYDGYDVPIIKAFRNFFKDMIRIITGLVLLLVAAEGIVRSSLFFAKHLNLSLPLVGILVVGVGNSLPELYFSIVSAKKGQTWMILGDIMGSVIAPATLVLGVVALIHPIEIADFSPFAIARIFLIISALFFLFCVRSGQKITRKEALLLLLIYIIFFILVACF